MTLNTNSEGVAVCRCGGELVIVCKRGCPDADVVLATELSKPREPWMCHYHECTDPIAPHDGPGRPTTMCVKHLEFSRRWTASREATARASTNGATP